jgi:hypothetical protein
MDKGAARYDVATLQEALLAHLFETKALLNVLERKGLLAVEEVIGEIRRLKEVAANPDNRAEDRPAPARQKPIRGKRPSPLAARRPAGTGGLSLQRMQASPAAGDSEAVAR